MTDLPPPPPGQQPAWQPPAGPPPATPAPGPSPTAEPNASQPNASQPNTSEPAPIRPYLPDPRAPKPSPIAAPSSVPAPPPAPLPTAPLPTAPAPAPGTPDASPFQTPPVPASPWTAGTGLDDAFTQSAVPTTPAPSSSTFTHAEPTATPPGAPPLPQPARSRSRVPAIIGAVLALAIGAAAVLWITGGDDTDDDSSDAVDTTEVDDATSVAPTTIAPEPTPAPTSTGPAVVLPTVAPTAPPETTPATPAVSAVPLLPAPPAPAGATPYADPAGWTIAVDPTWEFSQSADFIGWFTGTGTDVFADNVNVTLEDLPGAMSLDEYIVAAKGFISTSAADVVIADERRFAGADGVEVHVITWTGSVGGGQPLAFVQAMTVTATRAYVATFTSQPARMVDLATTIGPYLLTIRGT